MDCDAIRKAVDSRLKRRSRDWRERPAGGINLKHRDRVRGRVVADAVKELAKGIHRRFAENATIRKRRSRYGTQDAGRGVHGKCRDPGGSSDVEKLARGVHR